MRTWNRVLRYYYDTKTGSGRWFYSFDMRNRHKFSLALHPSILFVSIRTAHHAGWARYCLTLQSSRPGNVKGRCLLLRRFVNSAHASHSISNWMRSTYSYRSIFLRLVWYLFLCTVHTVRFVELLDCKLGIITLVFELVLKLRIGEFQSTFSSCTLFLTNKTGFIAPPTLSYFWGELGTACNGFLAFKYFI